MKKVTAQSPDRGSTGGNPAPQTGDYGEAVIEHPSWHLTIPKQGFVWCVDCRRTVYKPEQFRHTQEAD